MTAAAGFLLASKGDIVVSTLLATIVGLGLIIASGCVFNNYIDRGIDKKMKRTQQRALVSGTVSPVAALVYGTILGVLGVYILTSKTTMTATTTAIIGLFVYVLVYAYAKRRSVHGTVVGSIAGAIPPVVGYTAVTGQYDIAAGLLFLVLTCWQMPHFYAIAIYRGKDYKQAGIPVLPQVKGIPAAQQEIFLYILAFLGASSLLSLYGYTGVVYFIVMVLVSAWWLTVAYKGFSEQDKDRWAKKIFGISLLVLLVFSLMLSVDSFLP